MRSWDHAEVLKTFFEKPARKTLFAWHCPFPNAVTNKSSLGSNCHGPNPSHTLAESAALATTASRCAQPPCRDRRTRGPGSNSQCRCWHWGEREPPRGSRVPVHSIVFTLIRVSTTQPDSKPRAPAVTSSLHICSATV